MVLCIFLHVYLKEFDIARHMKIAFQKCHRGDVLGDVFVNFSAPSNFPKDLDCLLCDLDETERCSAWGKLIRLAFVKVGRGSFCGIFCVHKKQTFWT